jgi:tRNA modification GTPase
VNREFAEGPQATIVQNKVDLVAEEPAELVIAGLPIIRLSALTGAGLPLLIEHLKQIAGFTGDSGGTISARTRHVDALQRARVNLERATEELADSRALELAAEELRGSQRALSEITGELTSDDLLGEIFGSFCIGK